MAEPKKRGRKPTNRKLVSVHVLMPPALKEKLERIAEYDECTVSNLVNKLIHLYLPDRQSEIDDDVGLGTQEKIEKYLVEYEIVTAELTRNIRRLNCTQKPEIRKVTK
jgi:hypothetical protein